MAELDLVRVKVYPPAGSGGSRPTAPTFYAWRCPTCETYFETVQGLQLEDCVSIRCRVCQQVEKISREGAGQ